MKAIAIQQYGGPDVLELTEVPDPPVGPDMVLVRVRAAGVNPVDAKVRQGYLDGAWPAHFPLVPGWDVAGTVEAVGPGVWEYAPGDEVMGYVRKDHVQGGTYAALVVSPVRCLATKPASMSWAEAAGLPLVGLTAHQAFKAAQANGDDTVLVHAAVGGVGHVAVQLAVALGARVIGTASERNHDLLRDLGAEPVAYGEGLVGRVRELAPAGVDVVLDTVGGDALEASAELVRDTERLVSITDAARVAELGGRYVFVRPDRDDLAALGAQVETGRLRVVVQQTFPLADAAEAQALVGEGHVAGKIVLEV
ncbi:MAG TPA: NADP-dependent oxidoreductase [Jiangellales bacterium]|nr:NADP-dependent oxidoreductase [Jiangellales bacterium]